MWKEDKGLISAVYAGSIERVTAAMAANADINARNVDGSALEIAACYGHADIVRCLLAAGANLHGNNDRALWYAAANGHAEIVRILLAAGANIHFDDNVALRDAARYGHTEIVGMLLAVGANVHADGGHALYKAAYYGHAETARILLAAGADPMALWSSADEAARVHIRPTLDACADAMTPAQRNTLAKQSGQWVRLHALIDSTSRSKALHRW